MKSNRFLVAFLALPIMLLANLGLRGADGVKPSAKEQLSNIRRTLREARDKADWETYRSQAIGQSALLNGSPNSLLEVAKAELRLGNVEKARAEVQAVLDMGQASEVLASAPFDGLHDLAGPIAAIRRPIARGTVVWQIGDAGLLPEDIDFDPSSHRFFLTSVLEKKIISLDATGKARDFTTAPDGWPMLGVKVDAKHRRLWATEVALDEFSSVPKADWKRSALLCYDLDKGTLTLRIEGPNSSALGDMALLPDGSPIVSDGDGGGIYRLRDNKNWERIDHGEFISPQTIAVDADGSRLFVPDYLRGIGIIDLATSQVVWLTMNSKFALAGIDGLYWLGDSLLAVQNGSSPERVVEFDVDKTHSKIVNQTIIEASTSTLGDPTHGAIVGEDFYYIANSGWDRLDEHGDRVAGAVPTPARIMRVPLKK